MSLINFYFEQLNQESATTRKMLQRIPNDKYDWAPHVKSMDIRRLATHIAELPTWITMAFTTEELDFASAPYSPEYADNNEQLMQLFEKSAEDGRSQLIPENESRLNEKWVLRNGDTILVDTTRSGLVRIALSQIIHHRAQLGVYLRLLNVPIPGSYGPSADEMEFQQSAEAAV
ncbi:DinB family protein [Mucilaginibacter litoreus]|uniref:DinB family protein n=1 Tax=Mucilaginibacter litoreus TaxID=1048221 RepID=A0ABW3AR58_9SPHI